MVQYLESICKYFLMIKFHVYVERNYSCDIPEIGGLIRK